MTDIRITDLLMSMYNMRVTRQTKPNGPENTLLTYALDSRTLALLLEEVENSSSLPVTEPLFVQEPYPDKDFRIVGWFNGCPVIEIQTNYAEVIMTLTYMHHMPTAQGTLHD